MRPPQRQAFATGLDGRQRAEVTDMRRTPFWPSTALALAALVLAAAALASPALASMNRPAPADQQPPAVGGSAAEAAITVHGTGKVTLTPDMAIVVLGADAQSSSAKAAQANASALMNAVIAAVKKHGVAPADMATVNVSLGPVYDYNNGTQKLTGYHASQSLQVKVRKLSDTGSLIDDAVAAGATQIAGVSLSVADQDAAAAQARTLAVADAKQKAEALAKAAGVTLGAPIALTETSSPIPTAVPAYAAGAAKDVALTVVPGSFEVTVDVDVSYAID